MSNRWLTFSAFSLVLAAALVAPREVSACEALTMPSAVSVQGSEGGVVSNRMPNVLVPSCEAATTFRVLANNREIAHERQPNGSLKLTAALPTGSVSLVVMATGPGGEPFSSTPLSLTVQSGATNSNLPTVRLVEPSGGQALDSAYIDFVFDGVPYASNYSLVVQDPRSGADVEIINFEHNPRTDGPTGTFRFPAVTHPLFQPGRTITWRVDAWQEDADGNRSNETSSETRSFALDEDAVPPPTFGPGSGFDDGGDLDGTELPGGGVVLDDVQEFGPTLGPTPVTLCWQQSEDANAYEIQVARDVDFNRLVVSAEVRPPEEPMTAEVDADGNPMPVYHPCQPREVADEDRIVLEPMEDGTYPWIPNATFRLTPGDYFVRVAGLSEYETPPSSSVGVVDPNSDPSMDPNGAESRYQPIRGQFSHARRIRVLEYLIEEGLAADRYFYRFVRAHEPFALIPDSLQGMLDRDAEGKNLPDKVDAYLISLDNPQLERYVRSQWPNQRDDAEIVLEETGPYGQLDHDVVNSMRLVNRDHMSLGTPGSYVLYVGEIRNGHWPEYLTKQVIAVDDAPPMVHTQMVGDPNVDPGLYCTDNTACFSNNDCSGNGQCYRSEPCEAMGTCGVPGAYEQNGIIFTRPGMLIQVSATDPVVEGLLPLIDAADVPAMTIGLPQADRFGPHCDEDSLAPPVFELSSGVATLTYCEGACQDERGHWDAEQFMVVPDAGIPVGDTSGDRIFYVRATDHVGNASEPVVRRVHVVAGDNPPQFVFQADRNEFMMDELEGSMVVVTPRTAMFIRTYTDPLSVAAARFRVAHGDESLSDVEFERFELDNGFLVEEVGRFQVQFEFCDRVGNKFQSDAINILVEPSLTVQPEDLADDLETRQRG